MNRIAILTIVLAFAEISHTTNATIPFPVLSRPLSSKYNDTASGDLNATQIACSPYTNVDIFDSPYTNFPPSLSELCHSRYLHYLTQTTSCNIASTTRTFFSGEETVITNSNHPEGTTVVTGQTNFMTYTGLVTGNLPRYFNGHASPPCCSTCSITAETVQLYFWPPQKTAVNATGNLGVSTAVLNNFTFTSPSAYIGFSVLSAANLCGTVGKAYASTTLAFGPSELSTLQPCISVDCGASGRIGPPKVLNFDDLGPGCDNQEGYFAENPSQANGMQTSLDPCHPYIALPSAVQNLDPAWDSCVIGYYGGFYDPPRTLTPVIQMRPDPTSSPVSSYSPLHSPALPADIPTSPTPTPTTTPVAADPETSPIVPTDESDSYNPTTPAIRPATFSGDSSKSSSQDGAQDEDTYQSTEAQDEGTYQSTEAADLNDPTDPAGLDIPVATVVQNPTIATFHSEPIVFIPSASNAAVIAGHTLTKGAPDITIDGTPIQAKSNGVVIGGTSTVTFPSYQVPAGFPHTTDTSIATGTSGYSVIAESVTFSPNDPAATASGTTVSEASNGRPVVDSVTFPQLTPTPKPLTTIAGQPLFTQSNGALVVDTQTILPGGSTAVISGTVISVASNGQPVIDGNTLSIPRASPYRTIVSQPLTTASNGALLFGTQAISQGASATTFSGITISIISNGYPIIAGGTLSISSTQPLTTIGGQQLAIAPNGTLVIGTQTLSPGGPAVTISSTTISAASDGSPVVNGHTHPLPVLQTLVDSNSQPVATITCQASYPAPCNAIIVGTQTLLPNGPGITISGTTFSVASNDDLIIGTRTIDLSKPSASQGATQTEAGLAGFIISALGGGGISSSSSALNTSAAPPLDVVAFTGDAVRRRVPGWLMLGVGVVIGLFSCGMLV